MYQRRRGSIERIISNNTNTNNNTNNNNNNNNNNSTIPTGKSPKLVRRKLSIDTGIIISSDINNNNNNDNPAGPISVRNINLAGKRRESRIDRWNSNLSNFPLLSSIEYYTGIKKIYLAILLGILLILFFFRGTGLSFLSGIIGFAYPLHMSLKTIKQTNTLNITIEQREKEEILQQQRENDESLLSEYELETIRRARLSRGINQQLLTSEDRILALRQWIVYWMIYGLFTFFEAVSDNTLSWIPFYYPLKLLFLLWCFLPQYQGSNILYLYLLRPLLHRHHPIIQESVQTVQAVTKQAIKDTQRFVRTSSVDLTSKLLSLSRNSTPNNATAIIAQQNSNIFTNRIPKISQQITQIKPTENNINTIDTATATATDTGGTNNYNTGTTAAAATADEEELRWNANPIINLNSVKDEDFLDQNPITLDQSTTNT